MNHSLYSADRATYARILLIALVAGVGPVGLGLISGYSAAVQDRPRTLHVVKAKVPVEHARLVLAQNR